SPYQLRRFLSMCAMTLLRDGVDPGVGVVIPYSGIGDACTVGMLSVGSVPTIEIKEPKNNPLWTKTERNGVVVYKFGRDPRDTRLVGDNVVLHEGNEIRTGDLALGSLGVGPDSGVYCGASTDAKGIITLRGRVDKHSSTPPNPQAIADALVRFGYPKEKIIVEPISGHTIT
ncbi:MAG: hypothetical protein V1703_03845, partial [Candidatus Altiarchaeota archaeon]